MILVKKKYLYILVALVCLLLVFGEFRFFMALRNVELAKNLEVKYEVESFIFASIILTIAVSLFLVYFMRKSDNVLRRLDKMIELSEFGQQDISGHLNRLDRLGEKIEYILYNYRDLNEKKTLRISSLSGIVDFLVQRSDPPVFLLNRHGNIIHCSDKLPAMLEADKGDIIKKNFNDLFREMSYDEVFYELEEKKGSLMKDGVRMELNGKTCGNRVEFYPVFNANGDISHTIGVVGA